MISKGRMKGTIRFSLTPANKAQKVLLAGEFSNWQPVDLQRQRDGTFSTELALPAGTYQYKFICDGLWVPDPDNNRVVKNAFGTTNSVAVVTG